ncbi:hypothetical protein J6590_026346 [Homalodisca vitripennis]|nr:hypothetical protein J6590_026346 [Homalodisca vitripennis]
MDALAKIRTILLLDFCWPQYIAEGLKKFFITFLLGDIHFCRVIGHLVRQKDIFEKETEYTLQNDEYNLLIAKSSENIEVLEIQNGDIVDYKNWSKEHYKKTVLSKRSLARIPKDQKFYTFCSDKAKYTDGEKDTPLPVSTETRSPVTRNVSTRQPKMIPKKSPSENDPYVGSDTWIKRNYTTNY